MAQRRRGRQDEQRAKPQTLALAAAVTFAATVGWVLLHNRLEALSPEIHFAVSIAYPLVALAFVGVISRSALWTWFNILIAASVYHVFAEWAL